MFTSPRESSQESVFSVSYVINHAELQLGRKLGQGGFGVVYQSTYRHNDVAVKQLLMENISIEAAAEFEAEAKVMAQLRSPNIVQFYGFCVSPNYCIVMEYMPNGSLFSVLRSNKPLEWPTRFRIAMDIVKGLSYLHHENILHRDIKSLNVLLDEHDKAKLTDFGLSKVKNETRSHTVATKTKSDSVGTTQWMAPELFKGRKAVFTHKSDIYSLAVTFWEIAARKIPFSDASSPDLIPTWVQQGDREDIPTDCPPALSALIQACWEGDPNERPSADDVVTRLKSVIEAISGAATHTTPIDNFVSQVFAPIANLAPVITQPILPVSQLLLKDSISAPAPTPQMVSATSPLAIAKPAPRINPSDVSRLLKLVAEGEQDQAETMFKITPDLALELSDVTDLSNRTFKGITAFQYAVWALDWHMWTMLRKYLSDDAAHEQIQSMETGPWISQHGKSASWQNLINALQKQIDLLNKSQWIEAETQWQKEVGGAQRLLPAHVINEYCHPSRPFEPCPDFTAVTPLPRTRQTDQGEWFTATCNKGLLGDKFAVLRYTFRSTTGIIEWPNGGYYARMYGGPAADLKSCLSLYNTRTQQKDQLVAELTQGQRQRLAAK